MKPYLGYSTWTPPKPTTREDNIKSLLNDYKEYLKRLTDEEIKTVLASNHFQLFRIEGTKEE